MPGRSGASTGTGHRWPRAGLQFLYVFPFIDVAVGKGGDEEVVDGGDCRLDAMAVEPADHVLVAERIVFDVDLSYDSDDTGMQFCADGCGEFPGGLSCEILQPAAVPPEYEGLAQFRVFVAQTCGSAFLLFACDSGVVELGEAVGVSHRTVFMVVEPMSIPKYII